MPDQQPLSAPKEGMDAQAVRPMPERDRFTAMLKGLDIHASEAETKFINQWDGTYPTQRWGKWMLSWIRCLDAYHTPLEFLEGIESHVGEFTVKSQVWSSFVRSGGNHQYRGDLIRSQRPYEGKLPSSQLPFRYSKGCKLCENLHQVEDAKCFPQAVPNNAMIDLGKRVVLPNRYPQIPLSLIWLPKDHDELSLRIALLKGDGPDGKPIDELIPEVGKTRDALTNPEELHETFEFANAVGLVALRNHRLSGKSIPEHDHWLLYPLEAYPAQWFKNLAGILARDRHHTRAQGTPYDILVISGLSLHELAYQTSELMNQLERSDGIFSPYFIPGTEPMVLVAPLRQSAGNRPVKIGGGVQVHEISGSEAFERFEKFVPKCGEFAWAKYGISD